MSGAAEADAYPEVTRAVEAGFGHGFDDDGEPISVPQSATAGFSIQTPHSSSLGDQATRLRELVAQHDGSVASPRAMIPETHHPKNHREDYQQFASPKAAPVIAIASGKGGVGKSTIALNIATASRRRCTLVDLDLGTANLDVMCGVSPRARMDLELFNPHGPDLAAMTIRTSYGFGLIPGAAGVAGAANLDPIQRRWLLAAVQSLGSTGETVIADMGAGIGLSVIETVAAADLGLIVTTPDPAAIADAYAIIKCVVQHRGDPRPLRMGIVVTMVSGRNEARTTHARIDRVCRRFLGGEIPLLGMVRRDGRVVQAARHRAPLLANRSLGPAARDLRGLAALVEALAPVRGRAGMTPTHANA